MVYVNCRECGKGFRVKPYRLQRSPDGLWCSFDCKSNGMTKATTWNPSPTVAAYLAGILDGEGSIMILHRQQKGSQFHYAFLVAVITNTSPALIKFIVDSVGSGIPYTSKTTTVKRRDGTPGLPVTKFWFTHWRAVIFLTPLLPYLVIKGRKAELGIEFQNLSLAERRLDAQGQRYREQINEFGTRYPKTHNKPVQATSSSKSVIAALFIATSVAFATARTISSTSLARCPALVGVSSQ